jgi:hypothetical protein
MTATSANLAAARQQVLDAIIESTGLAFAASAVRSPVWVILTDMLDTALDIAYEVGWNACYATEEATKQAILQRKLRYATEEATKQACDNG